MLHNQDWRDLDVAGRRKRRQDKYEPVGEAAASAASAASAEVPGALATPPRGDLRRRREQAEFEQSQLELDEAGRCKRRRDKYELVGEAAAPDAPRPGAMGKKKPPKCPRSGFAQFFAEKREDIKATLLQEQGVVRAKIMSTSATRAGEMWKALGEEGQKSYKEKNEKLPYKQEMEASKTATPDFKKVKKVGKEARPPTRPAGAYGTWIADNWPTLIEIVMKKHSVDKRKAFYMVKKEGKPLYDALPAATKEKCAEKAEAAKVKFQAEFKEWKKNHKGDSKGGNSNGPKRPLGAYPQWISENRPMLTEQIMKKLGVGMAKASLMCYKEGKPIYDALPAEEKKKCEEKAEAAKVKFQSETKEWEEKNKGAKSANGAGQQACDSDSEYDAIR
jgi:hypothetical protein